MKHPAFARGRSRAKKDDDGDEFERAFECVESSSLDDAST